MNADIAHVRTPQPLRATDACARHFAIRLSPTPRGVRLARRLASGQLDDWGWPYDMESNRTVSLLVAELAANAVRHGRVAGRDFRLRLTLVAGGEVLRIEVTDARPDHRPPTPGALELCAPDGASGRGLLLVEALSTRWGTVVDDPYTKTVWCEVALQ